MKNLIIIISIYYINAHILLYDKKHNLKLSYYKRKNFIIFLKKIRKKNIFSHIDFFTILSSEMDSLTKIGLYTYPYTPLAIAIW